MTKRETLFAALRNEEVEQVPWVPFVGCHGAKLQGVSAETYFKSTELLVKGAELAYEKYDPSGLPAFFDLQVEAEALGCDVQYADTNPPSVKTHPLSDNRSIEQLSLPTKDDGRFPIVLDAIRRISVSLGDKIGIYGLITGPFTLALHLRGTNIFYDMLDDPGYVQELMTFCTDVAVEVSRMYMEAGADIIAVVDPMTSQISASDFEQFVSPHAEKIFAYIRSQDRYSSFFVCGNAKNNIEAMCKTKPDNVSIDENIPLDYVRDICRTHGISFGGNIKLTLSILFGSVADNMRDAMNCLDIGGKKGFILAPGCDLPFDSPEENLQAIASVARGELPNLEDDTNALENIDVELPDYDREAQVIVDVITIDSASCAPCQYMVEAVARNVEQFDDQAVYREHKIKDKEAVVVMSKLGVTNIPTTVIDGTVKFVSRIPDEHSLYREIEAAVAAKQSRLSR